MDTNGHQSKQREPRMTRIPRIGERSPRRPGLKAWPSLRVRCSSGLAETIFDFPAFLFSLLKSYAGAIADVMVSSGTIAKCSVPFSSYETISDVFLVEKLTESRWGTRYTSASIARRDVGAGSGRPSDS